jgi:hypothetical protein
VTGKHTPARIFRTNAQTHNERWTPLTSRSGLVIAGFFGFIKAGGQMAAWRWFFRAICEWLRVPESPFSLSALCPVSVLVQSR